MGPVVRVGILLISPPGEEPVMGLGGHWLSERLCTRCLFLSCSPGGRAARSLPLPARWHLSNAEFYTTFHSLTPTRHHVTYTTTHVTSDSGP